MPCRMVVALAAGVLELGAGLPASSRSVSAELVVRLGAGRARFLRPFSAISAQRMRRCRSHVSTMIRTLRPLSCRVGVVDVDAAGWPLPALRHLDRDAALAGAPAISTAGRGGGRRSAAPACGSAGGSSVAAADSATDADQQHHGQAAGRGELDLARPALHGGEQAADWPRRVAPAAAGGRRGGRGGPRLAGAGHRPAGRRPPYAAAGCVGGRPAAYRPGGVQRRPAGWRPEPGAVRRRRPRWRRAAVPSAAVDRPGVRPARHRRRPVARAAVGRPERVRRWHRPVGGVAAGGASAPVSSSAVARARLRRPRLGAARPAGRSATRPGRAWPGRRSGRSASARPPDRRAAAVGRWTGTTAYGSVTELTPVARAGQRAGQQLAQHGPGGVHVQPAGRVLLQQPHQHPGERAAALRRRRAGPRPRRAWSRSGRPCRTGAGPRPRCRASRRARTGRWAGRTPAHGPLGRDEVRRAEHHARAW